MEVLANTTINSYKIKEQIGAGGFSTVYQAMQQSTQRDVAIKVILPELAGRPEFINRFEKEAQIIARLEHLHITPLYDYWRDADGAYLVMRYMRGGSVASAIEKQPFSLEKAARLLDQVASALHSAHQHEIIHRDVKPGNIMLDEDGNAFLSDFGIARDNNIEGDKLTRENVIIGSLDYLSPEQARNEPVTPQTDIYSLGVTLYEILTGSHPFHELPSVERLYKHIYDPLPLITSLDERVRDAVNRVIAKATAKKPADRYSDVLAFAAAFRDAIREPLSIDDLDWIEQFEPQELNLPGDSNEDLIEPIEQLTSPTMLWDLQNPYKGLCASQTGNRCNIFGRERPSRFRPAQKGGGDIRFRFADDLRTKCRPKKFIV